MGIALDRAAQRLRHLPAPQGLAAQAHRRLPNLPPPGEMQGPGGRHRKDAEMRPNTLLKRLWVTACALSFTAGLLLAGAEVNEPTWWPWANLAGGALFLAAALVAPRLSHRPAPWR
jgi:hypothetical protein